MDDYRVELFIFPDGMAIEMIVFDQDRDGTQSQLAAVGDAAGVATQETESAQPETTSVAHGETDVSVCPVCHSHLVYPTDWQRTGSATWELALRCPNCETQRAITLDREGVERFNKVLYEGSEALARQAEQLTRLHFEEEAERFVRALDEDLILPMDF
jgi:hypothetical protein